jgi:hypothetical protein
LRKFKRIANLVYELVQFLLDTRIGVHKDVLCAFGEKIGLINGPSQRSRQGAGHKLFKVTLELRTHHEIGAGIANVGCQLVDLILQAFDELLILDLLAPVSGDLLREVVDDGFLLVYDSAYILGE